MSLTARIFLPEHTRGPNELYERHPELWHKCRISIDRDWTRPFNQHDAALIDSLPRESILSLESDAWPKMRHLAPWERGLLRYTGAPASPPFLWKGDHAIGWRSGPWLAIYECASQLSLELLRMLPARGGGYSRLSVKLRNPFSLAHETVESLVLSGTPIGLDRISEHVAAFWELPLHTVEDLDY
jgi:hypothetical protein